LLDRVADQVVVGRRLRESGQDRRLARGQLVERFPEVRARRRLDAVCLVPVVVLVEVGRDDLALALFALEELGDADGLDDLLELPLERPALVLDEARIEQARAHELLGDRGGASAVPTQRIDAGGDDGQRIEAGVLPERLVLDRRCGIEQERRDLLERDDVALELAEAGQFDAVAVQDHRLFGKGVVSQRARGLEVLRDRAIHGQRGEGDDQAHARQEREDDDGDPAERGSARCGRALALVGLRSIGS
jgi:hypothetical protein